MGENFYLMLLIFEFLWMQARLRVLLSLLMLCISSSVHPEVDICMHWDPSRKQNYPRWFKWRDCNKGTIYRAGAGLREQIKDEKLVRQPKTKQQEAVSDSQGWRNRIGSWYPVCSKPWRKSCPMGAVEMETSQPFSSSAFQSPAGSSHLSISMGKPISKNSRWYNPQASYPSTDAGRGLRIDLRNK